MIEKLTATLVAAMLVGIAAGAIGFVFGSDLVSEIGAAFAGACLFPAMLTMLLNRNEGGRDV